MSVKLNLATTWNSSKIEMMVSKLYKAAVTALFLVALAPALAFAGPGGGTPVSVAPSACDPDYYDSLKSRAWMEAQREITQNQNLIFKPDSVFEYTCFDKFANELADHAKDMFSETQRWGPIPGITIDSMDNALQNLVGSALIRYVVQNFDENSDPPPEQYDLLGGRLSPLDLKAPTDPTDRDKGRIDYTPKEIKGHKFDAAGNYQSMEYNCGIMNMIWMKAKCMDFIDNLENDGFYTFEEYRESTHGKDKDKRFLPSVCKDPGEALYKRWKDNINWATVNADYPDGTKWKEDLVQLFFDKINPTTLACDTMTPIKTGITVTRPHDSPQKFDEGVCIPAGCYAAPEVDSDGNTALTCKAT